MIADTLPPREYSEEASDYPAPIAPAETDDHADNEVYADAAATESEQDLAESLDGASDRDEDTLAGLPEIDIDSVKSSVQLAESVEPTELEDRADVQPADEFNLVITPDGLSEDVEPPVNELPGDEEESDNVDHPEDLEEPAAPNQTPTDEPESTEVTKEEPTDELVADGSTNDRDGGSGHPDETTTGFDDPEDPDLGDDAEDNPEAADDVADPTEYLGRVATEEEVETENGDTEVDEAEKKGVVPTSDYETRYRQQLGMYPMLGNTTEGRKAKEFELGQSIRAGREAQEELGSMFRTRAKIDYQRRLELENAVADGLASRTEFISANLRIPISVADKFPRNSTLRWDARVSVGNQALIEAVDDFDENRGTSFSTFAIPRIHTAISNAIVEDGIIRTPHSTMERALAIDNAENRVAQELGRNPTAEEISQDKHLHSLGYNYSAANIEKIRAALQPVQHVASIDNQGGHHGDDPDDRKLADSTPDIGAIDPQISADVATLSDMLSDILDDQSEDGLTSRQVTTIKVKFGLIDGIPCDNFQEVARIMGVSDETARKEYNKGLGKLKNDPRITELSDFFNL